jgi:hypothetical protein
MDTTLAAEIGSAQRVTFVGLAKNTGKTEALTALMEELSSLGRTLAITSIGRDGEAADAIQPRIAKPRIHCPAGSLVATTAPLLSRCVSPYEILLETGLRTPLGQVVVGRLHAAAEVEVAGASTSTGIRAVTDAMLGLGAEHTLIDGSIDRRAASAPKIADVVVLSTGAVLGREIDEVVRRTDHAVGLIDLPLVGDSRIRDLATEIPTVAVITEAEGARPLPNRFALTAESPDISAALGDCGSSQQTFVIAGTLPERFLDALTRLTRSRRVQVIASDATKVFLRTRSPYWYRETGVDIQVLRRVNLRAITVNPVAPLSHRFDSDGLRAAITKIASRVPIFDVKSHSYRHAMEAHALSSAV